MLADAAAGRVMSLFGSANAVGGVVVYLFLAIAGQENAVDTLDDLTWGPLLFAGYAIAVVPFTLVKGTTMLERALAWQLEGREPTLDERCATVLLPRRFVGLSASIWTGGNVAFAIANTINGDTAREVMRSIVGTALGGATTGAMCYLVVERTLRPSFDRVLRDAPLPVRTLSVRKRLALAWALGSGIPLASIASSPIGPDDESVRDLAVLAAIGLVAGGALISVATRSVSDRLNTVRAALERVRAGDLSVEVPVDDAGDIGTLQQDLNAMVRGLRERQVIADLFGRHVGHDVARLALQEGVHLGGEQRDVSVLFLDVTGSTALAASRPASEVVALLNRLFRVVVRIVGEEGGWVDKFEGDAALCVFGAPAPLADHATRALRAARRLRDAVGILDFGVGVSSGVVVAGNVGSETRFEYTVIGDPVNEAARLTEEAKSRESRVLAAARSVERADQSESAFWVPAATIPLRGRPDPTPSCEPRSSSSVVASPSPNT